MLLLNAKYKGLGFYQELRVNRTSALRCTWGWRGGAAAHTWQRQVTAPL